MKKLALLLPLFLLLVATAALGQDYDGALKTAKKQGKPVLVYFFSKTCYYCTLMDKTTLSDKGIESTLQKDFVYVRVDTDKSADLKRLYEVPGTPSSWFLESSGKRIFQAPGYVEKGNYKILLDYIKEKHYKDTDLETYFASRSKK
jgi:thioredoxin-related protein